MPSCLDVVTARAALSSSYRRVSFRSTGLAAVLVLQAMGLLGCSSKPASRPGAGLTSARADAGLLDAGIVIHHGPTASDAGASDAGSATLDPTLACIEYMRGLCERSTRCAGAPREFDSCMRYARFCPDVMFAPGSVRSVEGTLACADGWRELSCDAVPSHPACAMPGTRADGEPCIASMQCASLLCTAYGDSCGICASVVGAGEPCAPGSIECDDGLACSTDEPYVCEPLEPRPPAPAPLALGDECNPSTSQCYPNACRLDGSVYRCQPYPTLGQSCSEPLTCAFDDSYCDVSQVCTAFPPAGASCGVDAFTSQPRWCGPDAFCVGSDAGPPVCQAASEPGETCDVRCVTGYACECDDTACVARHCSRWRYPGETCGAPGDTCLAGHCDGGTCRANADQGLFQSTCGH